MTTASTTTASTTTYADLARDIASAIDPRRVLILAAAGCAALLALAGLLIG